MSIIARVVVTAGTMAMVVGMAMCTGCMSIWSEECSKDEIKRERVYASGNKDAIRLIESGANEDIAIRAINLGPNAAGIGIDVSNWQAISKHPVRQIGAALLDAGMMYGTYRGVESISDSSHHDTTTTAGRDVNNITVTGDGNHTSTANTTSTSTTSTGN